jgi:hypothetical protein
MGRYRTVRCSQNVRLLSLIVLAWMLAGVTGTRAQPNPGIDPCSRALAGLATPAAVATPDPGASRLAASQAIMNFASCFNRHNWDGVLALSDAPFRQSFIGAATDDETRHRLDRLASRKLLPEIRIQSIEESGATSANLATMAVTWRGWHGLHRELWRLQQVEGNWKLSRISIDRPQITGVAAGIELTSSDSRLTAPRSDLVNPGTIILGFDNQRATPITALVLAVAPNATASVVAAACNDPDVPLDPAGSIAADPAKVVYLPLMDLPPGRYAVVVGSDPCMGSETVTSDWVAILDVTI